jgi:RNA polymerase sigma-70 factor (ECF subfamily)
MAGLDDAATLLQRLLIHFPDQGFYCKPRVGELPWIGKVHHPHCRPPMTTSSLPSDLRPPERGPSPDGVAARDRAWAAAVRTGDAEAFEAMFRAYKNDLVAFAARLLGSREPAQEVVQEIFLRIWQQRELWEFAGALNSYLFRAARNGAISRLRHERIETRFRERVAHGSSLPVYGSRPDPTDARVRAADLTAAIERAVSELPERCREVFCLSRYHHLSNAEVADVLGISVNTVEVQMTRALSFLRKRLADFRD